MANKLPAFVALAFPNGIGYRYLYVRIKLNSTNDGSISCKDFVNFGPVIPKLTVLVCDLLV